MRESYAPHVVAGAGELPIPTLKPQLVKENEPRQRLTRWRLADADDGFARERSAVELTRICFSNVVDGWRKSDIIPSRQPSPSENCSENRSAGCDGKTVAYPRRP